MSVVDEIKARLDLVAYISESVPLKKAGRSYKACCPFHQERTPSFVVFPETQSWHCFGACAEGGDILTFAMKQHGWTFNEALENLARQAGVELRPHTPEQARQEQAFERALGLLDETARFYHQLFRDSPEAEDARAYVRRRALNDQTVGDFLLGYAPDGWQRTIDHLTRLGYALDDLVEIGVAIRNEQGRVYDRFRHRLIIPVRDGRGRTIGFGARALRDEDTPKYLNSPQSEVFDKSAILFGLDLARREIRETETAIIVEGYMDVMQAHQAGFRNVVAQMGTALTEPQLRALRRYAGRVILALDADQAGVSATMRGLNVARESLNDAGTALFGRDGSMRQAGRLGIDMRVLVISAGKDPDDLIRQNPDEWRHLVEAAEPVADYVIRVGTAGLNPARTAVAEREKIARLLLPLLTATESDLQKEVNVQKLAYKLHLPEKRLMEIAMETRAALAPHRSTDARVRQRRPTRTMQEASRHWRRPQPPRRAVPAPPEEAPPPASEPPEYTDEPGDPVDVMPPDFDPTAPPWEEGPLSEAPASAPARRNAPARPPEYQPSPAHPVEAYLLRMLLLRPEMLYQANRALREVAETAQARFSDEARKVRIFRALGPLSVEDFRDSAHQMMLRALQESLNQDTLEPLEYVRAALGEGLAPQLAVVLNMKNPVESKLPDMQQELHSIGKDMRRQGRILQEPEAELVDKVFILRRDHLRRISDTLRFVIAEADVEERREYSDTLDASKAAVVCLDKALQTRSA